MKRNNFRSFLINLIVFYCVSTFPTAHALDQFKKVANTCGLGFTSNCRVNLLYAIAFFRDHRNTNLIVRGELVQVLAGHGETVSELQYVPYIMQYPSV
jgi:hypothetical protein